MGDAVLCEAKREGRRDVGLGISAGLKAPRCRVLHPPECQTARLKPQARVHTGLGSSC